MYTTFAVRGFIWILPRPPPLFNRASIGCVRSLTGADALN
jgi:hypothetical protein